MDVDKEYRVMIHQKETLVATYTLRVEYEDGELVDVSAFYTVGDIDNDPIEDEVVDAILAAEIAHGKELIKGLTVEWFLIN